MIKQIRTSKFTKVVACYLAIMMFVEMTQPIVMYALTSGPTQPEFSSFTPISTSDMVNLTSGDFNYNIPIMDVGGYPLNLSYNSGVTMDQEASWAGLGWNLNVGQIQRQVRGLPDDFRGDKMRYENDLKDNITVGTSYNFHAALFGLDFLKGGVGIGVQYNNYEGITFKPTYGVSFELSKSVSVGANFASSVGEGATVSPSVSISSKVADKECSSTTLTGTIGVGFNSRKGLENLNMSFSTKQSEKLYNFDSNGKVTSTEDGKTMSEGGGGGSLSLNNSQNYTPTKRVAYDNLNFTFNAALGTEIYGGEGQGQVIGYGSFQRINPAYKNRQVKAFGYENTEYKGRTEGVLDFNREQEQSVSKNTTALPVTNYTYDTYSIQGQGVSGMFRPYRSQVSYMYNDDVTDRGLGISAGAEFGAAQLAHIGINFLLSPSTSSTGRWVNNNNALSLFNESSTDRNKLKYEPTTLKLVGELDVDKESSIFSNQVYDSKAVRIKLNRSKYNNSTAPIFTVKNSLTSNDYTSHPITSKIKRTERYLRNQEIQKVTAKEAANDPFIIKSNKAQPHHTAGIKVLQADGSTYVYGQAVYNTKKVEATFDISRKSGSVNVATGIVPNITSVRGNNARNSDKFLNKVTTPAFAHSYLITSVLSADYEDLDEIGGPSEKDLGTYTKFEYGTPVNLKWRVPYKSTDVSFNAGLLSNTDDEKGNYIYGEKELTYLKRIITKTHVAIFTLSERDDAKGAKGEINAEGAIAASTYKIDKISLYSLPEAKAANLLDNDPANDVLCSAIKTAHFDYSYELCKNTPNNSIGDKGKLTLKRVYFTYRNSNMGRYTPYVFDYSEVNPEYNIKGFDVWGNYKPNLLSSGANPETTLSNAEFPFVDQDKTIVDVPQNKTNADFYTSAWTLKSITLPSGGKISIDTESDDYQYVQNKKAMQMFKVVGAGNVLIPSPSGLTNTTLYNGNSHNKYLYVNLGHLSSPVTSVADFKKKYLSEQGQKSIYFRFLLNMTSNSWQKDYVTGYFNIESNDTNNIGIIDPSGSNLNTYVAIRVHQLDREGGIGGGADVNPIAKAGWGFGRMYLNRIVYSIGGNSSNTSFVPIVYDLVGSIGAISELWKGPNKALQDKGCARRFDNNKSWIRLENPDGHKLGGGSRVKSIKLSDNWDVMSSHDSNPIYKQEYGQTYNYNLDGADGKSSGVATYEPNASPENPLVEPFYPNTGNYADRIAAPKDQNYVEKPFGGAFFPSATVTYSKVTVSNLPRNEGNLTLKKHATGKVVTEHFTSYDFPTLVDYTRIDLTNDPANPFTSFLNILSINHLAATQGFSIETNDMNGKIKSQNVYSEDGLEPISGVVYNYNVDQNKKLDNNLTTIDSKGIVNKHLLGVEYDMINDFNESKSKLQTFGFDMNIASMIVAIFPLFVPVPFPKYSYHETNMRTAVTTKVIHKTGILIEKVAFDVDSRISTKNLAWDANTGQILLTQTVNEFDDKYYSFNYPAYWNFNSMGLASENIDISGKIKPISFDNGIQYFTIDNAEVTGNIDSYFKIGDELTVNSSYGHKLWVAGYNSNNSGVELMSKTGEIVENDASEFVPSMPFKITRSGYRNQQMASMASVTSMINPIDLDNDPNTGPDNIDANTFMYTSADPNSARVVSKIVNASAIEYGDDWKSQCENGLPNEAGLIDATGLPVNPFLYNTKGDWRPVKSYAYLTGRNNFVTTNRRNAGYFMTFNPFYKLREDGSGWSSDNHDSWTYASEVTKYSPYGVELENKDALDRYSSAQYGYKYTLPVAVASNTQYREIGFDGFEDYDPLLYVVPAVLKPHFGFSQNVGDRKKVVNTTAHTGNNSIAVDPNERVTFIRKIDGCKTPGQQNPLEEVPGNKSIKTIKTTITKNSFKANKPTVKGISKKATK